MLNLNIYMHNINICNKIKAVKTMVFKISLQTLPEIREVYEIERKTIWRCADRHNILILITEGACQIDMDDKNIMLKKGDYILIPPGKKYWQNEVEIYRKAWYTIFIL